MSELRKSDPDAFKGTAWYYSRFRPQYPSSLVTLLRDTYRLDGSGRLLDLGCGTGMVAIPLAHLFDEVVAIDPEPEMLAEGREVAKRAGVANIDWRLGRSDNLPPALGQFRLVTMGNSFHWMERERALDTLYDLVADDGGLAVVGHGAPIPAPPPTRWRTAINDVIRKYRGDIHMPWYPADMSKVERHETILARSRFKRLQTHNEMFEVTWTLDTIIGNLFSMSFCSRRLFGDRVDDFERDVRRAVLEVEPSGILTGEPPEFFALTVWKR